jgi:lambda repressor-like predicted transcriptional regulator
MSNERLKAALDHAGITIDELADQAGVDTKTIERWLSGRVPHRRSRQRVARLLGRTPHELWPDAEAPGPDLTPTARDRQSSDLLGAYQAAADAPDWQELLETATREIDLLDLTLHELITTDGIVQLLAEKANQGVEIRILLSDPESVQLIVVQGERDLHPDLTALPALAWEVQRTLGYLQPLLTNPRVHARTHVAAPRNTILRVDDEMLVTLHLWGAPPALEPRLHLRHEQKAGLFARFAHHYELIWQHAAAPVKPDPDRYPDPDEHPAHYQPTRPTGARDGPFGPRRAR